MSIQLPLKVNMGADHKPVMCRVSEVAFVASVQGTSEKKIWMNRIRDNFMRNWLLDLVHKEYKFNRLL